MWGCFLSIPSSRWLCSTSPLAVVMSTRPCQGGFALRHRWLLHPMREGSTVAAYFACSSTALSQTCTFLVSTQWITERRTDVYLVYISLRLAEIWNCHWPLPSLLQLVENLVIFFLCTFYDSHLFLLCFVNCERISFSCLSSEGLFALWNSVNLVALQPQLSDESKKLTILLIIWLFLMLS